MRTGGDNMGEAEKTVSRNKKAYHDYFIEDTYEAGIELYGTEIKSIRQGSVNLKDSWCQIKNGEIFGRYAKKHYFCSKIH